jgi:hypothetical protein
LGHLQQVVNKETQALLRLLVLYGCIIFASFLVGGQKFGQIATIVFSLANFRSEEEGVFVLPEEREIQNEQLPREERIFTSSDE